MPDRSTAAPPWRGAPSVAALTYELKRLVEGRFPNVAVQGEVTQARVAGRGHFYFTLKDPDAQLKCVVWASALPRLEVRPADGAQVVAQGAVEIYPPHGQYQLVVRQVTEVGHGRLLARLNELKERLHAEGLFDAARKRPLPFLPACIGLVTAPTGAAVRDFLTTVGARYPARVLVYPALVQGPGSVESLCRGLRWLGRHPEVDLVVLARGGGSLEDLWSFNEEAVVRAIAACPKPVVSAVGHEIDTPLSDFVADARAATPTAAAQLCVPDRAELQERVARAQASLARQLERAVGFHRQRLDLASGRLARQLRARLGAARERTGRLEGRLRNLHPRRQIALADSRRIDLTRRLGRAANDTIVRISRQHARLLAELRLLSPTASLARGYAIVRGPGGSVLRRATQVGPGQRLEVLLGRGALDVAVERVHAQHPLEPEDA